MEFLSAILGIIIIDLVLSGDNAVVIGMAAARLEPRQRRLAVLFGGGAAIVLRISLTAVAALLLTLPAIKAIGGVLLLFIAFRLLKGEDESSEGVKEAGSLREAIVTILLADFIMSLDNVLGVAAASHGHLGLLLFGLILSMAILMVGGTLIAGLINRLWWLAYVGAAVIAWTGSSMVLEDDLVLQTGLIPHGSEMIIDAIVTVVVVGVAYLLYRRIPAQRRKQTMAAAVSAAEATAEAEHHVAHGNRAG